MGWLVHLDVTPHCSFYVYAPLERFCGVMRWNRAMADFGDARSHAHNMRIQCIACIKQLRMICPQDCLDLSLTPKR